MNLKQVRFGLVGLYLFWLGPLVVVDYVRLDFGSVGSRGDQNLLSLLANLSDQPSRAECNLTDPSEQHFKLINFRCDMKFIEEK